MPKEITEDQKAQVRAWFNSFLKPLKLTENPINIKFHTKKAPRKLWPTENGGEYLAHVTFASIGTEMDVDIWAPFWSQPVEYQEKVCLHELVHVLAGDATEEDEICKITEVLWCLIKGLD